MIMEYTCEEEEGISIPQKRARMNCIIHCSDEEPDSKLVSPKYFESWITLLRAAEIRNYDPILGMSKGLPEGEIPAVRYHRKCRSIFTMKLHHCQGRQGRNLERLF